ncbi:NAD-dependent epimerase/dehydratase family protein [Stenotrophomonas sp. YIM B06876]|uniref:NAD-dependent epimerase/dehydratase family protein n=1 Tax=Stenotrophomonas sp. YIM B06876 TaxID=3060211 RepID=UPI0027383B0B|nr:NAD-dependent epimerase/dehydratase family protein [Stenotrophomonas sp. YIM B06876]
MKILLAGATGLVGAQVLTRLLGDRRCRQVVAPTRRALAHTDARLLNPVLDFEHLPAAADWWQVDAVICALGTTIRQAGSREAFWRVDHDYPLRIARAVHAHGARTFVLNSAMGADAGSRIFYNRVKGTLEHDLRGLGFDSLTLVRPGLIGGERAERRTGEHLASVVLGALAPVLPRAWRINPAGRIAAVMVEAALDPVPGVHVIGSAQLC